jgi:hypothetical protein
MTSGHRSSVKQAEILQVRYKRASQNLLRDERVRLPPIQPRYIAYTVEKCGTTR